MPILRNLAVRTHMRLAGSDLHTRVPAVIHSCWRVHPRERCEEPAGSCRGGQHFLTAFDPLQIPPPLPPPGGSGWAKDDYCEYDLDNEDEDWLDQYNRTAGSSASCASPCPTQLLSDVKFEKMLWKLDVACAEAMDRALTAAGASAAEKMTPAAVANTSHLSQEEALALLRKAAGGKEQVGSGQERDSWRERRD
jgi:hypothetical protein